MSEGSIKKFKDDNMEGVDKRSLKEKAKKERREERGLAEETQKLAEQSDGVAQKAMARGKAMGENAINNKEGVSSQDVEAIETVVVDSGKKITETRDGFMAISNAFEGNGVSREGANRLTKLRGRESAEGIVKAMIKAGAEVGKDSDGEEIIKAINKKGATPAESEEAQKIIQKSGTEAQQLENNFVDPVKGIAEENGKIKKTADDFTNDLSAISTKKGLLEYLNTLDFVNTGSREEGVIYFPGYAEKVKNVLAGKSNWNEIGVKSLKEKVKELLKKPKTDKKEEIKKLGDEIKVEVETANKKAEEQKNKRNPDWQEERKVPSVSGREAESVLVGGGTKKENDKEIPSSLEAAMERMGGNKQDKEKDKELKTVPEIISAEGKTFLEKQRAEAIGKAGNKEIEKQTDLEKNIAGSESFEDLLKVIETSGGIQGSQEFFDVDSLKNIINKVKNGDSDITAVTRTGGLRQKVGSLLALEKPKTENEIKLEELRKEEAELISSLEGIGPILSKPVYKKLEAVQKQIKDIEEGVEIKTEGGFKKSEERTETAEKESKTETANEDYFAKERSGYIDAYKKYVVSFGRLKKNGLKAFELTINKAREKYNILPGDGEMLKSGDENEKKEVEDRKNKFINDLVVRGIGKEQAEAVYEVELKKAEYDEAKINKAKEMSERGESRADIFQKIILDELQKLQAEQVESWPIKEQGVIKKAFNWLGKHKYVRLVLSTAAVTGAVAAIGGFSFGAAAAYGSFRFIKGGVSMVAGSAVSHWLGEKLSSRNEKNKKQEEDKLKENNNADFNNLTLENLSAIEKKQQDIFEKFAKEERKKVVAQILTSMATGMWTNLGMGMLESAYAGGPRLSEKPATSSKDVAPDKINHGEFGNTDNKGLKSIYGEPASDNSAAISGKMNSVADANIHKGEGAWRAVHDQIKNDPDKFGIKIKPDDAEFDKAVNRETLGLLKKNGFIDDAGNTKIGVYEGTKVAIDGDKINIIDGQGKGGGTYDFEDVHGKPNGELESAIDDGNKTAENASHQPTDRITEDVLSNQLKEDGFNYEQSYHYKQAFGNNPSADDIKYGIHGLLDVDIKDIAVRNDGIIEVGNAYKDGYKILITGDKIGASGPDGAIFGINDNLFWYKKIFASFKPSADLTAENIEKIKSLIIRAADAAEEKKRFSGG